MNNRDFYKNDDYYESDSYNYSHGNVEYPQNPQPKKSKILTGVIVGLLASASLLGVGVGIYYWLSGSNNNSSNNQKYNTSLSLTGKYISQRTLSLQFLTQVKGSKSGELAVSSGTGWIINKEKNSDVYYIATNLHVAAMLTYENHNVYSYEDKEAINYGTIQQSLVGYISSYNENTNEYTLSMITVPKPTIAYITAEDSSWTSLGYPDVSGNSSTGSLIKYPLESDFAILKYDFSNLLLSTITSSNVNPNNSTDVSNFKNWLDIYDNNPTKLLNKSIQDVSNWESLKYSMGGFPAQAGTDEYSSSNQNKNYSNVAWREFTNFSISLYPLNSGMGNASEVSKNSSTDPIVYVNQSDSSQSGSGVYDKGYINGAYGAQLTASSAPGSSGSMVITYIDNEPIVVGIYWGSTSWTNSSNNTVATYGAMDFLNTNTNSDTYSSSTYKGYDLFSFSYNYLINNNGASLYYNPTTNSIVQ